MGQVVITAKNPTLLCREGDQGPERSRAGAGRVGDCYT